jgi:putative acetyltransferase
VERDVEDVHALTSAAFRRDGDTRDPRETLLLKRLRVDPGWLPALSLVAVIDGGVAGHVVCTRGYVDGAPALGLGPISVLPARQGAGVGQALMHAVLGAADARGEPLVAVLGDPAYYRRFGFVAAGELGIVAPDARWADNFQVRPLASYVPQLCGTFRYATPFDEI